MLNVDLTFEILKTIKRAYKEMEHSGFAYYVEEESGHHHVLKYLVLKHRHEEAYSLYVHGRCEITYPKALAEFISILKIPETNKEK